MAEADVDPKIQQAWSDVTAADSQHTGVLTLDGVEVTKPALRFLSKQIQRILSDERSAVAASENSDDNDKKMQQPVLTKVALRTTVSFSKEICADSSVLVEFLEHLRNVPTLEALHIDGWSFQRQRPFLDTFAPLLQALTTMAAASPDPKEPPQPKQALAHQKQQDNQDENKIKELRIARVHIRGAEMGRLLSSCSTVIAKLELVRCVLDAHFLQALATSAGRPPAASLKMFNCNLVDAKIGPFLAGAVNTWQEHCLESLDCSMNNVTSICYRVLAALLVRQKKSLKLLDLSDNRFLFSQLTETAFQPLQEAFKGLQVLENLQLHRCLADNNNAQNGYLPARLGSIGRLVSLQHLNLAHSGLFQRVSPGDVEVVSAFTKWIGSCLPSLKTLDLTDCQLQDHVMIPLFRALELNNSPLELLRLDGNHLTVCGWEQSLPKLVTLQELHMNHLVVREDDVPALERALMGNSTIVTLTLQYNSQAVSNFVVEQILRRNKGIARARQALSTQSLCDARVLWPLTLERLFVESRSVGGNQNMSACYMYFRALVSFYGHILDKKPQKQQQQQGQGQQEREHEEGKDDKKESDEKNNNDGSNTKDRRRPFSAMAGSSSGGTDDGASAATAGAVGKPARKRAKTHDDESSTSAAVVGVAAAAPAAPVNDAQKAPPAAAATETVSELAQDGVVVVATAEDSSSSIASADKKGDTKSM